MRVTIYDNTGEFPQSFVITINRWGMSGVPTPGDAKEVRTMEEWFEPALCPDCEDLEGACRFRRIAPCAAVVVHRHCEEKRSKRQAAVTIPQPVGDPKAHPAATA